MPNHVHLLVAPSTSEGLAAAIGKTHHHYTSRVNKRRKWKGCLWQGRFFSAPMDELHVLHTTNYILSNPVRANLVEMAFEWPHSSAKAHLGLESDPVVDATFLAARIEDWDRYLNIATSENEADRLRSHTRTGRPLGGNRFLSEVEKFTGRKIRRYPD